MDSLIDVDLNNRSRVWWVSLFLFFTMFLIGMFQELYDMFLTFPKHTSNLAGRYYMMLVCFALLLTYFIPFVLFICYTCRRLDISGHLPLLAFFSGWFIPGWLAGSLNDRADRLLKLMISPHFDKVWGDAAEAPIVEETLKVLVVVWLLYILGRYLKKDFLVAGMAVGMGFQIGEDFSYIEDRITGSFLQYSTAIGYTIDDRISWSLPSHWMYTALVAVGVYYIFFGRKKEQGAHAVRNGILLILLALLEHAYCDSPFPNMLLPDAATDAVMLLAFYVIYVKAVQEQKKLKSITIRERKARKNGERVE